jgi:molybdopterin/thiamine biosynthesis adenylyltransferase
MNTNLDLRRQSEIFDAFSFNAPVTVIGCGASGSWLVLALAKLGITNITVYDYDVVEEHNIPNQAFGVEQVGMLKVGALSDMLQSQVGLKEPIKIKAEEFKTQRLSGIVFLMVDSMKARKEIWDASIKMKSAVKLLVEPRMGGEESRVYNVIPTDLNHIKRYEDCWYSDEEAQVSACGTSISVVTTAMSVASTCVRQLISFHNGVELDNEILTDYVYNNIYPTKW